MALKVATAYEGPAEREVIDLLITRLLYPINIEVVDSASPHTGLIAFLVPFISRFSKTPADIFVFFTDTDGDSERKRLIKQKIDSVPTQKDKVVIALSDPHFEAWLLADQENVKRLFDLSHTDPLPYADRTPKDQLKKLQTNMPEGKQLTQHEVRLRLVEGMDFDKVADRCKDFKDFRESILTVSKNT